MLKRICSYRNDNYRKRSRYSAEATIDSWPRKRAREDRYSDSGKSSYSESQSSTGESEDEIVHFVWQKGMPLGDDGRYEIVRKLGDGTFGRVLECIDHGANTPASCRRVAIKVIRDVERYVQNAHVEAKILQKLHEYRRSNRNEEGGRGIVRLYDVFYHKHRIFCISFEPLGKTLYEIIQLNNHKGFFVSDIQLITRELLEVVDFIHTVCGLTHTDIKMENIMLTSEQLHEGSPLPHRYSSGSSRQSEDSTQYIRPVLLSRESQHKSIRLIDFGNGVFPGDRHSAVINTRQYRSPEVILEQEWDSKSDMWSVGCVIAEMFTGELLFGTHSNSEHLALIEAITEEKFTPKYFSHSPSEVRRQYQNPTTGRLDAKLSPGTKLDYSRSLYYEFYDYPVLEELVSRLLRIDPLRRYSARRALDNCQIFTKRFSINE